MLEAERQKLILNLVQERSIISISDLAEILDASDATVRRDVNAMAERGEIRRVRGGVEAIQPTHQAHLVGMPFALSRDLHVPQKRAIAQAAAALIEDGDSIIISGGTTTFALVEFLTARRLDILTNSIPIVTTLLSTSRNRVTIPGGTVYREQNIVLSPFEGQSDTIENFWAKKMFTSCYGLNRFGLMETDPLIVQSHVRLLKRAESVIVMADSSKLRQRSSMIVAELERISTLITDDGATEEELSPFAQAGIKIVRVHAESSAQEQHLA